MTRKGGKRPTPMRVADRQAEAEALDLRLQGLSYRAIGEAQGCHTSVAHDRVNRALADLVPVEQAEAVRAIEAERYEAVQARVLAALGHVTSPDHLEQHGLDPDAIAKLTASFVRVADRKAKLLGLDLPVTQTLRVQGDLDAEVQALVDELAQAAQQTVVEVEQ